MKRNLSSIISLLLIASIAILVGCDNINLHKQEPPKAETPSAVMNEREKKADELEALITDKENSDAVSSKLSDQLSNIDKSTLDNKVDEKIDKNTEDLLVYNNKEHRFSIAYPSILELEEMKEGDSNEGITLTCPDIKNIGYFLFSLNFMSYEELERPSDSTADDFFRLLYEFHVENYGIDSLLSEPIHGYMDGQKTFTFSYNTMLDGRDITETIIGVEGEGHYYTISTSMYADDVERLESLKTQLLDNIHFTNNNDYVVEGNETGPDPIILDNTEDLLVYEDEKHKFRIAYPSMLLLKEVKKEDLSYEGITLTSIDREKYGYLYFVLDAISYNDLQRQYNISANEFIMEIYKSYNENSGIEPILSEPISGYIDGQKTLTNSFNRILDGRDITETFIGVEGKEHLYIINTVTYSDDVKRFEPLITQILDNIRFTNNNNYVDEDINNLIPYQNEKYGFSLVYPKDWDIIDEPNEYTPVSFRSPLKNNNDFRDSITIAIYPTDMDSEALSLDIIKNLSQDISDLEIVSYELYDPDIEDIYEIMYTGTMFGKHTLFNQVLFVAEGKAYTLTAQRNGEWNDVDEYYRIFYSMIESLRF